MFYRVVSVCKTIGCNKLKLLFNIKKTQISNTFSLNPIDTRTYGLHISNSLLQTIYRGYWYKTLHLAALQIFSSFSHSYTNAENDVNIFCKWIIISSIRKHYKFRFT